MTTYGDLSPGAPRFAGSVLSTCHDPDVPWHRVVRADGSEELLGATASARMQAGDAFEIETPGGGGYGA